MLNTPNTMSTSIFTNFPTNMCENKNPTIGSNNGQRTITMCLVVDANGSFINSWTKEVNICVNPPLSQRGDLQFICNILKLPHPPNVASLMHKNIPMHIL
jgi:hypothetical protein